MPLDDTNWSKPDTEIIDDLLDAIRLLERALARVTTGYTWSWFYRRALFKQRPKFCMYGALTYSDAGNREEPNPGRELAEEFTKTAIGGRDLVGYGTRPFVRRRVKRAYSHALNLARAELASRG